MGWTPKSSGSGSGSGADGNATPPRPRRRARRAGGLEQVVADMPRQSTGARPRGGVHAEDEPDRGVDDRTTVKIRLGKRWSEIILAVKAGEYTWQEFTEGLDEEELSRGQLKDVHGRFSGRPPAIVPREFHLACQREMKRRFETIFSDQVLSIADEYLRMARSPEVKPEHRAKMLQYAMERVFGGIPKDITIKQEAPWEQMMVNVVSDGDSGMPAHLKERYARYTERQGGGVTEDPA